MDDQTNMLKYAFPPAKFRAASLLAEARGDHEGRIANALLAAVNLDEAIDLAENVIKLDAEADNG